MAWPIYRSVQRGPYIFGVPVKHLFFILVSAIFGYFTLRGVLGFLGALAWVGVHGFVYLFFMFLGSQDAMFVPRFLLMQIGKFYRKLTSFENTKKTWILLD